MRYPAVTAFVAALVYPAFFAYAGGLDIRVHPGEGLLSPPAEAVLVDPSGRMLGHDPVMGLDYREIPGSFYELEGLGDAEEPDAPSPESLVMEVMGARDGAYTLLLYGNAAGGYDLDVHGFDGDAASAHAIIKGVGTGPGELQKYSLTYATRPEVTVNIVRLPDDR